MVRRAQTRNRHTSLSLEDEIAHLRGLDLKGLRARWAGLFRKPAPIHLSRHLLLGILAYRLQADALGDLDAESIRLLKQIGAGRADVALARLTADFHLRRAELKPGSILTREWNGHPHRVMVVDAGFAWMGKPMTAYPRSPSPSPGPNGTARASSGCGTSCRKSGRDSRYSKAVRCAIYTRVSTDAGLDQEFNSLDAQYDAAQAYIRSQAHAGWA